jgi:hypothetical protein
MKRTPTIKRNDTQFGLQLQTCSANIGNYPQLSLDPALLTGLAADSLAFNYTLLCQSITQGDAQAWTAHKNNQRNGSGSGVAPTPTSLPAAPPAVDAGIETRFRALIDLAQASPEYTVAIGEATAMEGDVQTGPDLASVVPTLTLSVQGGQVVINWGFGGNAAYLDACEIEVDRGDAAGFKLLTIDSTANFTDTTAFPATPAKWTYRAIYRVGDARVGQWSSPVSIAVGG